MLPLLLGVLQIWLDVSTSTGLVNGPVTVQIVIKPLYSPLLADHSLLALVQQKELLQKFSDCWDRSSDRSFIQDLNNRVDKSMDYFLPAGRDYRLAINCQQMVEFGNTGLKTNDTSEFTVVTPNFKYKNIMVWVG